MIKIDIFVVPDDPYQLSAIKRKDTFEGNNSRREYYFSPPEDIIINKRKSYDMGGGTSERQWLDILGIIKVQGDTLDKKYLSKWTFKLSLHELLMKAFDESFN